MILNWKLLLEFSLTSLTLNEGNIMGQLPRAETLPQFQSEKVINFTIVLFALKKLNPVNDLFSKIGFDRTFVFPA